MFTSRSIPGATTVSRTYQLKQYATEGQNIPLKKNWADTWCTLTQQHEETLQKILDYEVRAEDVFLVTFIKTGTTWMQETAWLLMHDLDFERSKKEHVAYRSPFLGHNGVFKKPPNVLELSAALPSPRLLKLHMPANLLPHQIWERKQKIIYVARNVKDVIVSSFHFLKNLGLWYNDNIEEFADAFMNNEIIYCNYWTHVMDFWKMRREPFIFFVTYEEMNRDLAGVIQKLCTFLQRPQLTSEEMEKLLKHLSFDSMRENKKTNMTGSLKVISDNANDNFEFMRRGIVGSFKDELSTDMQLKIDNWSRKCLAEHCLAEESIFSKL